MATFTINNVGIMDTDLAILNRRFFKQILSVELIKNTPIPSNEINKIIDEKVDFIYNCFNLKLSEEMSLDGVYVSFLETCAKIISSIKDMDVVAANFLERFQTKIENEIDISNLPDDSQRKILISSMITVLKSLQYVLYCGLI